MIYIEFICTYKELTREWVHEVIDKSPTSISDDFRDFTINRVFGGFENMYSFLEEIEDRILKPLINPNIDRISLDIISDIESHEAHISEIPKYKRINVLDFVVEHFFLISEKYGDDALESITYDDTLIYDILRGLYPVKTNIISRVGGGLEVL